MKHFRVSLIWIKRSPYQEFYHKNKEKEPSPQSSILARIRKLGTKERQHTNSTAKDITHKSYHDLKPRKKSRQMTPFWTIEKTLYGGNISEVYPLIYVLSPHANGKSSLMWKARTVAQGILFIMNLMCHCRIRIYFPFHSRTRTPMPKRAA